LASVNLFRSKDLLSYRVNAINKIDFLKIDIEAQKMKVSIFGQFSSFGLILCINHIITSMWLFDKLSQVKIVTE
jgi:hypothetical protein